MRINDWNYERTGGNEDGSRFRLVDAVEQDTASLPFDSLSQNSRIALSAVDDVSRRIDDLARQLGCLGHFDQGDGPRAA